MLNDYSPIYQGDTLIPLAPIFQRKDGTLFPLVGITITMKMQRDTGTILTCTGTWTIDDATNGKAHYQWQAADVATAGNWTLYITLSAAGQPVHVDTLPLTILAVI